MKKKGIFIVFDGPNSSGKSGLIRLTKEWLESEFNREVTIISEPSKSPIGELVRHYSEQPKHNYTLACLVTADRYKNIVEYIIPAVEEGNIVISDRYFASSLVYQIMHGVEYDFILHINSKIIVPDLTIIVRADEKKLQERIIARGTKQLFENPENVLKELNLYANAIPYLIRLDHTNCCVDNSGTIDDAFDNTKKLILKFLKTKL